MSELYVPTTSAPDPGAYATPELPPGPQYFTLTQAARALAAHPFSFSGRAARSEFWWGRLLLTVPSLALALTSWWTAFSDISAAVQILTLLVIQATVLVLFVIDVALTARRLHDTGRSGWMQLLSLLPLVGWIPMLVMCVQVGVAGPNRHGAPTVPSGSRRSALVAGLVLAGLLASVGLGVAAGRAYVAAVTQAVDAYIENTAGWDTAGEDAAADEAAGEDVVPPGTQDELDPVLAAHQPGGCWSQDDADGMIAPIPCDDAGAGYVVTAVVDSDELCPEWVLPSGLEEGQYLCLTGLG